MQTQPHAGCPVETKESTVVIKNNLPQDIKVLSFTFLGGCSRRVEYHEYLLMMQDSVGKMYFDAGNLKVVKDNKG